MFNYEEIDKYVTLADLALIVEWLLKKTQGAYMVRGIERTPGQRVYTIHLTIAQNGFNEKVLITDDNEVKSILKEDEKYYWMS